MVSLSDEGYRQGGYFFGQRQDSEEMMSDSTTLVTEEEFVFKKIRTSWVIFIELIISILQVLGVFLLPIYCGQRCGLDPFSILVYIHASNWFLVFIIDRYYRFHHNRSRRNGYLEFYRKTRKIRRIPLYIVSGGNTLLLILLELLKQFCFKNKQNLHQTCQNVPLNPYNFLQILVGIEMVIVIAVLVIYLVWTIQFNHLKAPPDIYKEDGTAIQTLQSNSDVGFRDGTRLEEVVEKQADMIRYLRQHNASLGRRVLKLSEQLQNGTPTGPPIYPTLAGSS